MGELGWTEQQVAAIRAQDNTLLVANAGTGKTTTVVGKVLWLLGLEYGLDPATGQPLAPCSEPCGLSEIAAITFTEKAAYDLKRKLREAIEGSARAAELRWQLDRAAIGTIHSFCGTLLREHALRLDIDPTFRVLDQNESWAAQDDLIRELVMRRLATDDVSVQALLQRMKLAGSDYSSGLVDHVRDVMRDVRWRPVRYAGWQGESGLDREQLRRLAGTWDEGDDAAMQATETLVGLGLEAAAEWETLLLEDNARDFDSLILDVVQLLQGQGSSDAASARAALESIRRRYRVLIIDEFQDTDFAQRDIAFAIGRQVPRPQLFLVGDPKQSIYRFRGADVAVWNSVQDVLGAEGRVLRLTTNFRCDPAIVGFVNAAGSAALGRTAAALLQESSSSSVEYAPLEAGRAASAYASIEWLEPAAGKADELRASEARLVVERIAALLDGQELVTDPESGSARPCRASDIAVLYRNRTGLERFESELGAAGIPYWLAGTPHLSRRQEILDLVNVLRLLRNPRDDLRALGFLRSPFVCLRDEVVAGLRMAARGIPLLSAARRALDSDWFPAPEHARIEPIERAALSRGLVTIETLRELAPRLALDELLEELLERTGYRLHLLLADRPEEALANIQSFVHFAEGYRDLDIGAFLQIWERWTSQDLGIPQAPLYSKQDEVVTLTTVHAAKGLEWPVVFLIGLEKNRWRDPSGRFLADRDLGPVLCAAKADRGARNQRIVGRDRLEADAEEARLMYVATTRARDRLILAGPRGKDNTYGEWLEAGLEPGGVRVIRGDGGREGRGCRASSPPDLHWLDRVETKPVTDLVSPIASPPARFVVSATELMANANDPEAHARRFVHGVLASWEFLPRRTPTGARRLPATVRGTLIHSVLERIEAAQELSMILEETIGGLDDPELEQLLAVGSEHRTKLEQEIARVVGSQEWAWYVRGQHHRELQFAHLAGAREWRIGAFDLYRPGRSQGSPGSTAPVAAGEQQLGLFSSPDEGDEALIIDFKTHEIDAAETAEAARHYEIQAQIYRAAAGVRGPASVRLHFTSPNVIVEMPAG